ncbi:MAG: class I SAM-dependent methyltransferase [Proteobacteria bacterium]|nr:MAG: class I SAM-dependent methyltransferase [Pseudomonadota bacterium]
MKIRESGMPEQLTWETYFDAPVILAQLGLTATCHDVVEFGCGYGTFTIAAAKRVLGTVYALDIDSAMSQAVALRAASERLTNIECVRCDFVHDGTGLVDGAVDYAMLFNILHTEDPVQLLREARRNIKSSGTVGVMHWNYDPATPRGPPMAMRPRPEDCQRWAQAAGFECGPTVELPPYHYGIVLTPANQE